MWRVQARRLPHSVVTKSLRSRRIHASRACQESTEYYNPRSIERVEDEADVCIVGAGPAGLSAAIRIKQLERERGKEVRVVVLEKGGEVGK
jgi:electron-transferring-flavoprotein dehydrogenase